MVTKGVESKITAYIQSNPQYKEYSREKIVSIMLEKGELTRSEVQSWYRQMEERVKEEHAVSAEVPSQPAKTKTNNQANTSIKLFGDSKPISSNSDMGLRVESAAGITPTTVAPQNIEPKVQPQAAEPVKFELTEAQAQNEVINTIMEDVSKSYVLYQKQDNGVVSKGYDALKNYFDSELSSSNVEEALALQATGADNLMLARDGELTKREYYLQNKEHLKKMLTRRLYDKDENTGLDFLDRNRGNKSKEEFAKFLEDYIQRMIDNIPSMDSLKSVMHGLVTSSAEETEANLQKLLANAKNEKPVQVLPDSRAISIKSKGIPIEFDSEEPISFEEVFRYERGTQYSKEKVESVIKKQQELTFASSAVNKHAQFKTSAESLIKSEESAATKTDKIAVMYEKYYGGDIGLAKEKLDEVISQGKFMIVTKEVNGKLTLDMSAYGTEAQQQNILNLLLRFGIQQQDKQLEKVLGGKPEDKMLAINQDYEAAYTNAYGNEFTEELVQAMENDNKSFIRKYTGGASMAGMAMTVVGGILCFTPAAPLGAGLITAGNTLAIGGMAAESALGYTEALTREEVNEEELEDLSKQLIMNAGGFVVGYKASKLGMKAFNKLVDKKLTETFKTQITEGNRAAALKEVFSDPQKLGNFMEAAGAKIGTDFLVSYAGDLAMMGVLDTQDDWESLLKANLMGIIVGTSSDVSDIGKLAYRHDPKAPKTEPPKIDLSDETPPLAPKVSDETKDIENLFMPVDEPPGNHKRGGQDALNVKESVSETVAVEKNKPSTPETLKRDLLELEFAGEGKFWNEEKLDNALKKYDADDIKQITRIFNNFKKDKNYNETNACLGMRSLLSLDKKYLDTAERIVNEKSCTDTKNLIDAVIYVPLRLQLIGTLQYDRINELLDLKENCDNPALNIDNILVLLQKPEKYAALLDNLPAIMNAKDRAGNYIFNGKFLDEIKKDNAELITAYIKADGKLGDGVTDLFDKYPRLGSVIKEQIIKDPALTVEKFEAHVKALYQREIDKAGLKEEAFNEYLKLKSKDSDATPPAINIQGRLFKEIEENYQKIDDPQLKELVRKGLLNNELDAQKVKDIVDAYYTFKGEYAHIGDKWDMPRFREYYKYLLETNPDKARQYAAAVNNPDVKIDDPAFDDLMQDVRIDRMRAFIQKNPESEIGNHFYNEYYLKQDDIPADLKEKCIKINEKYGTKIFLSKESDIDALEYIDAELAEWARVSNGAAKYPAMFDFSKAKRSYIDPKSAYGQGTTAGYNNQSEHTIGMNGLSYNRVAYAIRHELTHANDSKHGWGINPKYNLDEIMPKDKDGKPIYKKCQFKDEFRRAGIPEEHIPYAYNNTAEFIAVAAEGDMSKYSPEFKQMLLDFGMPEWQLNMKDFSYWDIHKTHTFDKLSQKIELPENPDDPKAPKEKFVITEQGRQIINEHVANIRKRALEVENDIVQFMYDNKLGTPETMVHRAKSATSLYDKIANYLTDNGKRKPSIKDAVDDVRDAVGVRTKLENGDFTNHPDVQALLKAGDERGAILRAAELQSQPMVDNIKQLLSNYAAGKTDTKLTRISNYMGKDGIPYFSERQLEEIQRHAASLKIHDFSIVTRIDENDPHFTPEEIKAANKKATTKVRGSGYTALQMNFETKDGDVFEWQLRGEKVNVFGEAEHVPYDLRTGKDISAGNPELAKFYEPIEDLLSKENMTEAEFDEYNAYLTAHYEHLRKLELGFESTAPVLPEKFDKRLSAENLERLHDYAEKVKKGKMTGTSAKYEYERIIFTDPTRPKTQILEGGIRADELDEVAPYGQFRPETDSPVQTGLRATEAPKTNFENVEKLLAAYEDKMSDGDLLNLKKYLTANPDKQALVENVLRHFDEMARIRKEEDEKLGGIVLYHTKGEEYNDLFDCLRELTPEKEPYIDFYFSLGMMTKKMSNMNRVSNVIAQIPPQVCKVAESVAQEMPEVTGDIENFLIWAALKHINKDIYGNMQSFVKKYPEILDEIDIEYIAERAYNGFDMSATLEKNYQIQKQLLEEFPEQADYINKSSRFILHNTDIESVPLIEELNIRQDVDNIQTTMNFEYEWAKKLSDGLMNHGSNSDVNIDILRRQAELIKCFSEIKTEKGSLLDEMGFGNLRSILDHVIIYGNANLDIKQIFDKIEKLKDLTIETENGPKKVFGTDYSSIISLDKLIQSEFKDSDGKYLGTAIDADYTANVVEFLNKTGYSKNMDNHIYDMIGNLQYNHTDMAALNTAREALADIKFINSEGKTLELAEVMDFANLRAFAFKAKFDTKTFNENIQFLKENISNIKIDDGSDKELLKLILLNPNRKTDAGYDLHTYIKEHVLTSNGNQNIPPFDIKDSNELNIYVLGLKDEYGNGIYNTSNGTVNPDLNVTAQMAYTLAENKDIPNAIKKTLMTSYYARDNELCAEGIQIYRDLVKHGINDSYTIRRILLNGKAHTREVLDKIINDAELNQNPQSIITALQVMKTPANIGLYKKLITTRDLKSTEKILNLCNDKNKTEFASHLLDIDPEISVSRLEELFLYGLYNCPKEAIGELHAAGSHVLNDHNLLGAIATTTRNRLKDNVETDEKALMENIEIIKTLNENDIGIAYQQIAAAITDPANNKMSDVQRFLELMHKNMSDEQLEHGSYYLHGKSAKEIADNLELFEGLKIKDAKGKERPVYSILEENIVNLKHEDAKKIADFLRVLHDTEVEINNRKAKLIDVLNLNGLEQVAKIEDLKLDKISKIFSAHPEYAGTVDCRVVGKLNDFADYLDRTDLQINELSIEEKRNLLKLFMQYNADLYDQTFHKIINCDLIPHDKDSYCSTLPKLIKSLGLDTTPLTREVKQNYYKAMDSLADPNGAFMKTNLEDLDFKLELTYPRETFISHMQELMKDLTPQERMKATDYFGFEFRTLADGSFVMNGYPVNINNGAKMAEITDPQTKAVIEKMRPYVKQFSENNKIHIDGNPELAAQLNDIIKAFPEFLTTVGKVQHRTHDFTVDVHTLKVMQGVMSNPRYAKLPEADKRALQIATLMHDLTKAENHIDKTHPAYSAFDTYYLLSKMDMPESERLKIYQIIKNHDWLEQYNKKIKNPDGTFRDMTPEEKTKAAQDTAFELRQGNSFEMASILAEADLAGVKRNGVFFEKYKDELVKGNEEIGALVTELQKTAIHLPQERIPHASDIIADGENVVEVEIDGIKNKVVYLQPDMELSQYGFADGLNSNDLNVLVHAFDDDGAGATFQALGQIDSDALLSSSYITYEKGNYHVFRTQGFILDVASDDIHAAYYRDFGSGTKKDIELLKDEYLFSTQRSEERKYISELLKQKLGLSDEEYTKFLPEISDKSILELDKTHPEAARAMREIFDAMEGGKRSAGRQYNEILITRPKIQGIFFEGKHKDDSTPGEYTIDKVPEYLRRYAADNDLPIIFFGK